MSLINQIILLQEVDNKLFEINKLLGDLPSKVENLIQRFYLFKLKINETIFRKNKKQTKFIIRRK